MLLVFGSINADLLFEVPSLPRPGETVLCPGYGVAPGGKGSNQAAAAAKAGAEVRFIGHVGDDGFGPRVRGFLEAAGIDCTGLALSPRPTAVAVIGVDPRGENQIIVASGANLDTHPDQVADAELGPGVTVLCQNEIPAEATFALLLRARARGARTVLNLAPAGTVSAEVLDALDVLVVNEIEAAAAAVTAGGVPGGGADGPEALARHLARRHPGLTCVVTLGAAGALAVGPGAALRVGALRVTPVDTTGAGDAFVGVLAAALDGGLSLAGALRRAGVAAGLACEAVGAQTSQPGAAAIEARLPELPPPTALA
ncbi:MAG TPA: ribokinase [Geminicoccaceae bacterium]|nr:ribokinase [Geminicoccaceae bacterium]